jgi:hypothetical protein
MSSAEVKNVLNRSVTPIYVFMVCAQETQEQLYRHYHAGGMLDPLRFQTIIEYNRFSCRDCFQKLCIFIVWLGLCIVLVILISELVKKTLWRVSTVIMSTFSLLVCPEADDWILWSLKAKGWGEYLFGLRREEISVDEEHYLYSLPDIVNVIKSWRIRWRKHLACMKNLEILTVFCWKI